MRIAAGKVSVLNEDEIPASRRERESVPVKLRNCARDRGFGEAKRGEKKDYGSRKSTNKG